MGVRGDLLWRLSNSPREWKVSLFISRVLKDLPTSQTHANLDATRMGRLFFVLHTGISPGDLSRKVLLAKTSKQTNKPWTPLMRRNPSIQPNNEPEVPSELMEVPPAASLHRTIRCVTSQGCSPRVDARWRDILIRAGDVSAAEVQQSSALWGGRTSGHSGATEFPGHLLGTRGGEMRMGGSWGWGTQADDSNLTRNPA